MMGPVVAQYNTKYCRIQNTIVFCIRPYPPFSGPWCSGDTPFDKEKRVTVFRTLEPETKSLPLNPFPIWV